MDIDKLLWAPSAVSAIVAAVVSSVVGITYQRRAARRQATAEIIDEFLSPDFLVHRAAVSSLRRKVKDGRVQLAEIAKGYWYPGPGTGRSYQGDKIDTLNEHQHLTIFIGYVSRLAHRVRSNNPNRHELRRRLRSNYAWHGDFMNSLAQEVRRQVPDDEELPSWVLDTEEIASLLELSNLLKVDAAGNEPSALPLTPPA